MSPYANTGIGKMGKKPSNHPKKRPPQKKEMGGKKTQTKNLLGPKLHPVQFAPRTLGKAPSLGGVMTTGGKEEVGRTRLVET